MEVESCSLELDPLGPASIDRWTVCRDLVYDKNLYKASMVELTWSSQGWLELGRTVSMWLSMNE